MDGIKPREFWTIVGLLIVLYALMIEEALTGGDP